MDRAVALGEDAGRQSEMQLRALMRENAELMLSAADDEFIKVEQGWPEAVSRIRPIREKLSEIRRALLAADVRQLSEYTSAWGQIVRPGIEWIKGQLATAFTIVAAAVGAPVNRITNFGDKILEFINSILKLGKNLTAIVSVAAIALVIFLAWYVL